jgi:hypothetical protein
MSRINREKWNPGAQKPAGHIINCQYGGDPMAHEHLLPGSDLKMDGI